MRLTSVLTLAAIVSLPSVGGSEEQPQLPAPLAVGTKVRIVAPTIVGRRVTGSVADIRAASLQIAVDDNQLTVPRNAITRLEVSTGKRRHALLGLVIGAAVGLVAACVSDCNSEGDPGFFLSNAGWGALWGVAIGALIKTDRWSDVPLEQVHVTVGPTQGHGIRMTMSVRF